MKISILVAALLCRSLTAAGANELADVMLADVVVPGKCYKVHLTIVNITESGQRYYITSGFAYVGSECGTTDITTDKSGTIDLQKVLATPGVNEKWKETQEAWAKKDLRKKPLQK